MEGLGGLVEAEGGGRVEEDSEEGEEDREERVGKDHVLLNIIYWILTTITKLWQI